MKNKLEAARQAKANQPKRATAGDAKRGPPREKEREDDDEVLLTRTDRSGQSWPLPDRTVPAELNKGRRKKKQKVSPNANWTDPENLPV